MKRKDKYKSIIARFLNLAPKERSKVQLCSNRIIRLNVRQPRFTTKQDVISFLLKNNIKTSYQLEKRLETDKTAPSMYNVLKFFGTWTKLSSELYGRLYLKLKKTDEDILRAISEFNIYTIREYEENRKKWPDIFLSSKCVRERFGSWKNAKTAAHGTSVRSILEQFIALKLKLHCWPTIKECTDNGIDYYKLTDAIPVDELKSIVRCLNKGDEDENKRRNRK